MAAAAVTVLRPVLPERCGGAGGALRGRLADQSEQSVHIDSWPASRLHFWVQSDTRLTLTLFKEGGASAHASFVLEVPVGELLQHSDRVQCWCALSTEIDARGGMERSGLDAFRAAERVAADAVCAKVFVAVCAQSASAVGCSPLHPLRLRWGSEDLDAHCGKYLEEQQLYEELSSRRLECAQLEREAAGLRASTAAAIARERAEQARAVALAGEAARARRGEVAERARVAALQDEMRSGLRELQQELRGRDAAWERDLAAAEARAAARGGARAAAEAASASERAERRAAELHRLRGSELEARVLSAEAEAAATASRGVRAEEAAARLREGLRGELQARDLAWQWRALAARFLAAAQAAGLEQVLGRLRARAGTIGEELRYQRAEAQQRLLADEVLHRVQERGLREQLQEEASAAERADRLLRGLQERERSEATAHARAASHAAELVSAASWAELEALQEAAEVRRLEEGLEELQQHHVGRHGLLQRALRELHGEQLARQATEWERCLLDETTAWASLVSEAELTERRESTQVGALREECSLERQERLRDEHEISQLRAQLRAMEVHSPPPLSAGTPPPLSARLPAVDGRPPQASRHDGPVVFPHAAEQEFSADASIVESAIADLSSSSRSIATGCARIRCSADAQSRWRSPTTTVHCSSGEAAVLGRAPRHSIQVVWPHTARPHREPTGAELPASQPAGDVPLLAAQAQRSLAQARDAHERASSSPSGAQRPPAHARDAHARDAHERAPSPPRTPASARALAAPRSPARPADAGSPGRAGARAAQQPLSARRAAPARERAGAVPAMAPWLARPGRSSAPGAARDAGPWPRELLAGAAPERLRLPHGARPAQPPRSDLRLAAKVNETFQASLRS